MAPGMIHYDYYADAPAEAIDELVRASRLCRLVTTGDALPHIGIYPFVHDDRGFALHLHKADEQIADLLARPSCVLEVDELLATIPSHWLDKESGAFATAYHRTVAFECSATLIEDAASIAQLQNDFLARYQPEGRHRPVGADDPIYAGMVRALTGVRLSVRATKVKFKLGQNRDFAARTTVVTRLRERGSVLDLRTADAIQWTIDLGWTTAGRARR
jgi:predicted FMN-binding regulatory protein PaiB